MIFEKYDWYEADGEIQKAQSACRDEASQKMIAVRALVSELGAKDAYGSKSIVGFSFNAYPPKNWIVVQGVGINEHVYRPNLRSKDRKALWDRIKSTKIPTGEEFSNRYGGARILDAPENAGMMRIAGPCFLRIGALCLFGVPKGYPEEALGKDLTTLRPVPLSEIFAAKEKSEMEATA